MKPVTDPAGPRLSSDGFTMSPMVVCGVWPGGAGQELVDARMSSHLPWQGGGVGKVQRVSDRKCGGGAGALKIGALRRERCGALSERALFAALSDVGETGSWNDPIRSWRLPHEDGMSLMSCEDFNGISSARSRCPVRDSLTVRSWPLPGADCREAFSPALVLGVL